MVQLKVALSHDVDRIQKTHQYLTRSLRQLKKKDLQGLWHELNNYSQRTEVYWNFPDIMKTEDDLGLRSTFFFLQESYPLHLLRPAEWKLAMGRYDVRSERIAKMIKVLDQGGWEIALHGSYRSYNNPSLLKQEKGILEKVLGKQIIGIRQHYLNLAVETWQYQENAGFKYDSSFGLTERIGFKEGKSEPFYPNGSDFCVIPLAIMDSCYAEDEYRDRHLDQIISQASEKKAILVLNWHSNSWDSEEYPGYKDNYINIIRRLIDAGAVFKTLGQCWKELASNVHVDCECSPNG